MRWSEINFHPSSRMLRQFAGLWLLFFSLMGGWQAWAHGRWTAAAVCWVLATTFGPLGLAWPKLMRPVFVGWMIAAFPIGWLVSHTILAVVFYGLFTPLAVVFRLVGRDALRLRRLPRGASYWQPKPVATDPRSYFRQY